MSGALQQRKHQSLMLICSVGLKETNNPPKNPSQKRDCVEMAGEEGKKKPACHKAATWPSVL